MFNRSAVQILIHVCKPTFIPLWVIVEFIWHYFSIHPRDKETIASRLALAGRAVAYGQDVDFQGPFPTSFSLSGNSLTIEYDDDLEVKNNEGFEVTSF